MISHIDSIHDGSRYRIKDREKALIFQEICLGSDSSRKSIAERHGLRPTTVSFAVQELINDGLIQEGDNRSPGRPGRPELFLEPNYNRLSAVSIYVRSRELEGVLVNLEDRVLAEKAIYIPEESTNEDFMQIALNLVHDLRSQSPGQSELLGVGVSLVGVVVPEYKLWKEAARWPRIRDLDFHRMEREVGIPVSLRRIHDTELEYLIEQNDSYRHENLVLFHWGYGIGAAYAHAGQVLGTTSGEFLEIGHTIIDSASRKQCQCGLLGCLETEAALWALLPEIQKAYPGIKEYEQELADLLQRQDILEFNPVRRALEYLTIGLGNLHHLINPDRILFIGPFTENPAIFQQLSTGFRRLLREVTRDQVALDVIRGGFSGCSFGSVYPFFRSRLKKYLCAGYP